ncbi:hypothetical protein [Salinarimonas rosea]|uniref:hypothetical protein n=1 Tax=Salinarimonas rosea TaxID=552063 RepID=UPI0003F6218D|nr:hypothetical protein [Salinarimonas rosea]
MNTNTHIPAAPSARATSPLGGVAARLLEAVDTLYRGRHLINAAAMATEELPSGREAEALAAVIGSATHVLTSARETLEAARHELREIADATTAPAHYDRGETERHVMADAKAGLERMFGREAAAPSREPRTAGDNVGTGFLDPALAVKVLPAAAGFPEFSIALLDPASNETLLATLFRAWRREDMRCGMLAVDAERDEDVDAIVDARSARIALLEATMMQVRAEGPHDIMVLLDVVQAIYTENDGTVCDEDVGERVRRLVNAARVASANLVAPTPGEAAHARVAG